MPISETTGKPMQRPTEHLAGILLVALLAATCAYAERSAGPIPDDFPRFQVPGHDREMGLLRELFWLHFHKAGPLATLWDEWMSGPTLWPAVEGDPKKAPMRQRWRTALAKRDIDPEGYVATHQHASIAHQQGWPFPFWAQGGGATWGWHFSLPGLSPGWHGTSAKTQEGWIVAHGKDAGIADDAWNIALTEPFTTVQAPAMNVDTFQSPFIQLRWRARGLGEAQPYLEWTTAEAAQFAPERRFYFPLIDSDAVVYTMIPVYRHPGWTGRVTGLRVGLNNPRPGGTIGIQALFTQYDTRHTINNPNFVKGCINCFLWTRDLELLREEIQRMRLALRYMMTEFKGLDEKVIVVPFVGHDGRPGFHRDAQGRSVLHHGHGIGHHYWDILPGGHRDAYTTMLYYDALRAMAALEREVRAHPEWNIAAGPLTLEPAALEQHAAEVRARAGALFWNPQNRRFVLGLDADGKSYDFGYTFMNLEAIYYGLATPEQAGEIMSWISGRREVAGDTAHGADIYYWRFAPRASTRRNLDWYGWYWSAPEQFPFGGQVQDGGAVLGFSYHDLMARIRTLGPDDAWERLRQILAWFDEVQAAGGYRAYYAQPGRGTLQGSGAAGGLGMDHEFFESLLVPQVMLRGFAGFEPLADGFRVDPRLPKDWPDLTIDRIALHELVLTVRLTPEAIEVRKTGRTLHPYRIQVPVGPWRLEYLPQTPGGTRPAQTGPAEAQPAARPPAAAVGEVRGGDEPIPLDWAEAAGVRLSRIPR